MKKWIALGIAGLFCLATIAQTKKARVVFQGLYWNYRNDSFPPLEQLFL